MGAHARTRRAPAARAAVAAALAAVAVSVLVGVGTAQEAPAAQAAGPLAAPLAPVVAPAVAPAPRVTPSPAPAVEDAAPVEDSGSAAQAREETAAPRSVPVRAEPARPAPTALVGGTPCTTTARACVDLVGRNAWLIDAGTIVRGPVPIMVGAIDDPTPRGTFRVQWKAEQYTSREFLTQMPYAVFFADGGIAFHEGRQDTNSRGCVKLTHDDAVAWFKYLQTGDEVQIR